MWLAALRERLRSTRARLIAGGVVVVLVAAAILLGISSGSDGVRVSSRYIAGTPEGSTKVDLDTSLYLPSATPAPAVLLSQGFGGDKSGLDSTARLLAQDGYVVLSYTARGFGDSGGMIHFAAPDYEIHDGTLLIDYLSKLKQVRRTDGKPDIATAGSSYGGGLSLLIAAADHRVRSVAADITWNNLSHALFPNFGGDQPGVFKKLWTGQLFGNAFGRPSLSSLLDAKTAPATTGSSSCGRFAPGVCAAYQASAAAGEPTPAMQRIMAQASPAGVDSKIDAPTLLSQGEQDSLFPLSEATANAKAIAAHGTPVRVIWRSGGHDGGTSITRLVANAVAWFRTVFHTPGATGEQPFQFAEQAGAVSAATGDASQQIRQAKGFPGIQGTPQTSRTVTVGGSAQTISSPAGGVPAVITLIPGLGGISSRFDQALSAFPSAPGQTAYFESTALRSQLLVAGEPHVRIVVTAKTTTDATLFVGLRDVPPQGSATLPSQLVAPVRLTGLQPGEPRTVDVRLPSFVRNVLADHQLQLSVSTTDFAYAAPADARSYTIALPAGHAAVTLPTITGSPIGAGHPFGWLIAGLIACVLVAVGVLFVVQRSRRVHKPRPDLSHVPVTVENLVKEYSGGYRAVDDISFSVSRGQVVGLLGPNGAGKTTALRVLVGLIKPTSGEVYVFGQPVLPGAPVLSRLGAFIEGPGFLPHLTGRENLRLYWAATGRPADEAEFETALQIAGLGASVDRRVRQYSQGMRQRLGIAQAMLGLPEVLVLDEPTNGLDPPQIAEMREVLQRYAATGRTVVVSSHLLAEVEQTCTDVVVMHRGRVVAAGSVAEIAGAGGHQLSVADPEAAARVLSHAGIDAELVPARRALEDVFLGLVGDET